MALSYLKSTSMWVGLEMKVWQIEVLVIRFPYLHFTKIMDVTLFLNYYKYSNEQKRCLLNFKRSF